MTYAYADQKDRLFTDEGQRDFLAVRDHVCGLLEEAGAFRMQEAMIGSGDSWDMLARVDRLVELGEIREIPQPNCAGQDRVFVRAT